MVVIWWKSPLCKAAKMHLALCLITGDYQNALHHLSWSTLQFLLWLQNFEEKIKIQNIYPQWTSQNDSVEEDGQATILECTFQFDQCLECRLKFPAQIVFIFCFSTERQVAGPSALSIHMDGGRFDLHFVQGRKKKRLVLHKNNRCPANNKC